MSNNNSILLLLLMKMVPGILTWCLYGSFTHSDDVYEASYSPDGGRILIATKDGKNDVYDAFSLTVVHTAPTREKSISAKFSPDGQYIAIGMDNDSVIILDGNTYDFVADLPTAFGEV